MLLTTVQCCLDVHLDRRDLCWSEMDRKRVSELEVERLEVGRTMGDSREEGRIRGVRAGALVGDQRADDPCFDAIKLYRYCSGLLGVSSASAMRSREWFLESNCSWLNLEVGHGWQ